MARPLRKPRQKGLRRANHKVPRASANLDYQKRYQGTRYTASPPDLDFKPLPSDLHPPIDLGRSYSLAPMRRQA